MIIITASMLTVFLVFISYVIYIHSIIIGRTKPSRSSFWVWTICQFLITASYYHASGNGLAYVFSMTYTIGCFLTAILSLRYGEGEWNRSDTICLSLCLCFASFWILSGSSSITLLLMLLIEMLGAWPILVKSWLRPELENQFSWLLAFMASIVNIFSVSGFNFSAWKISDIFYNIYYILVDGLITLFIWKRSQKDSQLRRQLNKYVKKR